MTLGEALKRIRERSGFTHDELARRVGVTPEHLYAVERGTHGMTAKLLKRIRETTGYDPHFLMVLSKHPELVESHRALLAERTPA